MRDGLVRVGGVGVDESFVEGGRRIGLGAGDGGFGRWRREWWMGVKVVVRARGGTKNFVLRGEIFQFAFQTLVIG